MHILTSASSLTLFLFDKILFASFKAGVKKLNYAKASTLKDFKSFFSVSGILSLFKILSTFLTTLVLSNLNKFSESLL